mmetsp:Transcript_3509/g.4927  ORF Transcript_3509/g.4927 Transcript_3509/m.4927 type:complete len:221 (+) Transcript_3509:81-743(+)|eukprot:CAMPEP_0197289544 /NCGR_PEP_ID=MMETSP0890-20130614/6818_1 /TAXON_ID=44058 ORGANISM="Aureoumbra lagunensis, Strain CCMP1510" /NCGR_SAMPLE_ID=MMETSP0890 /ASSEMBLY_ACC=CAM_ASM_000533 /LENGTH=220 /DNA_ID=CAMNT_0042761025 /DNA_START=21 /DNA_END=683 /DNA_ORIENTATION=-
MTTDLIAKAKALSKRLVNIESELKEKVSSSKEKIEEKEADSKVIYIGHIPHGFYEDQMEKFFSQFGQVNNVRVSRSKRTGGSKGYGFLEFESSEVARIAALTMNKYLMGNKQLVVHVVPIELASRPDLFKGGLRGMRIVPGSKKNRGKDFSPSNILQRQETKRRKINQALGFDYEFPGHKIDSQQRETTELDFKPDDEKNKKINKKKKGDRKKKKKQEEA